MQDRKKRQRRKTGRRGTSRPASSRPALGLRLALAILFLCGFLVGSLVLLSHLRQSYRPPAESPSADLLLADARVELESALLRSGIALGDLEVVRENGVTVMRARGRLPEERILRQLAQRLRRLSPQLRLQVSRPQSRLEIALDGESRFRLHFVPPPASAADDSPRVAIIIDDMGRSLQAARELLAVGLPVTFSVLPNTPKAAETATLVHRYGREVMLHLPMEPLGYPAADPGRDALMVSLSDAEIRRRFLKYLEIVPYAVGGNNHMGSRFTADRRGMEVVLGLMRREGLFFIDSRTSGASIAAAMAEKMGVPTASRDMFLDNEQDVGAIARQIRQLIAKARRKGEAIGICHPYPETIRALAREKAFIENSGVQVVPASKLLRQRRVVSRAPVN
ncbi:hypothetical protein EDC39_105116 [Geothermobacter ehrlichii]|uniref:Divergent polysaccharide deacetylase n=1 Tax=Geothermobacter ehrlichii TaxID=213224 RepID=A0A5D3WJK5_9BACT|nr:divergent polysaccharide deacetylase family protein [Geothermobacter ehrlichii]TYO98747.1 hypothetical protein EDC39_105116 [Geothermobacter ehrlichii]